MSIVEAPTSDRAADTESAGWEQIASFASPDAAAKGLAHLLELRYDPRHVAITPGRVENTPDPRLRRQLLQGARVGAAALGGLVVVFLLAGEVGLVHLLLTIVPTLLAASVLGGIAGAGATRVHQRRTLEWSGGDRNDQLRVTVFDVSVDRAASVARQDLARWWDPDALTVPRQHR